MPGMDFRVPVRGGKKLAPHSSFESSRREKPDVRPRQSEAPAAVRGHLHELNGDLPAAATAYAEAARRATNLAERDHLVRQAARART